jgi:hypothetical protein
MCWPLEPLALCSCATTPVAGTSAEFCTAVAARAQLWLLAEGLEDEEDEPHGAISVHGSESEPEAGAAGGSSRAEQAAADGGASGEASSEYEGASLGGFLVDDEDVEEGTEGQRGPGFTAHEQMEEAVDGEAGAEEML